MERPMIPRFSYIESSLLLSNRYHFRFDVCAYIYTLSYTLIYVYVYINIFQAFLNAWDAVCKGGSKGKTKLLVPRGKTFMIKPLSFVGPCKSSSVSFLVYTVFLVVSKLY